MACSTSIMPNHNIVEDFWLCGTEVVKQRVDETYRRKPFLQESVIK
eukprot:CAMPEP_0117774642 /NCGR_PEP_ID=MMETSP0947-20121206/26643_1 /TAXON_ID=44440 /ORGANISM="Chattonella subsalsa, Strain CCMP2191" /LENGTH=45 /DNA_ID= /DNA_START= /DNA_END= /DNA_ORIENTATION=